jgi:uncharacterized membrane protein YhaH (DUF805 family)
MLRTLFSFTGTISRRAYIIVALVGVLLKHLVDICVATQGFHREWSPLNYLVPLGIPVQLDTTSAADQLFLLTMLAVALPFAWVGLAITAKRFRAIGWPSWMIVLFFVPIANIVSFAVAALWPERPDTSSPSGSRWLARVVPSDSFGAAAVAVMIAVAFGVLCVTLATRALSTYAWGLFAAVPFSQGAVAAFLYGVHRRRGVRESIAVALLSLGLTLGALLAIALEGVICIAMAAPIALALGVMGALFGHMLQNRTPSVRVDASALLVLVMIAPAIMGAESLVSREVPIYVVRSEVTIDASPMTVWRNVVAFPDLPAPAEPIFRLGVAYPERARIVGRGVGAVRYCEFSTGDFVEPITAWEPGRRLAFRVAHNAEPMRELSPYPGLDTSHLHGYMVSLHGEFDLEPLPGGRTRLIGITWYEHHLWPASYWAVYSNAIVHEIHMRVLEHIKRISEATPVGRR